MADQYELLLACKDEPEAHRKDEGDIIDIRPAGWQWGRIERRRYLIVPVMGLAQIEVENVNAPLMDDGSYRAPDPLILADRALPGWEANKLYQNTEVTSAATGETSLVCDEIREGYLIFRPTQGTSTHSGATKPNFNVSVGDTVTDGDLTWECVREIHYKDWVSGKNIAIGDGIVINENILFEAQNAGVTGTSAPEWPTTYLETITDNEVTWICKGRMDAKQIGKRRHKVPFTQLKQAYIDLDIDRVNNPDDEYQPFKIENIIFEVGDGIDMALDKFWNIFVKKARKM